MAAYVCKSKNDQFSVDINNIFLLVSLDEGMDHRVHMQEKCVLSEKSKSAIEKSLCLPLLVSECIYPYLWPDGMPFFKPKQQNKKPFPDFNLRYLWLILWQPNMHYLHDLSYDYLDVSDLQWSLTGKTNN